MNERRHVAGVYACITRDRDACRDACREQRARANQWTNSSRVFSPLRHGIQHRRRSLMILCEIVIPIQIGMERNTITKPPLFHSYIYILLGKCLDRSIIEWKFHDYRIDRSLNIFRINIPNRVCETIVDLLMHLGTIRLVEINCGDFFHSILFFLFPDKSPPTVVFSWLPENLIKLCACFVSTKITELRDSLLSIVFVRHRGKPSCFLFIQFSILLFTFVFHVQLCAKVFD